MSNIADAPCIIVTVCPCWSHEYIPGFDGARVVLIFAHQYKYSIKNLQIGYSCYGILYQLTQIMWHVATDSWIFAVGKLVTYIIHE
jgi:hypothetical protein